MELWNYLGSINMYKIIVICVFCLLAMIFIDVFGI